jgi:hypothetical protein
MVNCNRVSALKATMIDLRARHVSFAATKFGRSSRPRLSHGRDFDGFSNAWLRALCHFQIERKAALFWGG